MANEENLIPNEERTAEELREMRRKGGIASGKARRRKAYLRKALNSILTSEVTEKEIACELDLMGFEHTYEVAVMLSLLKEALKGNVPAIKQIVSITGAGKDELDKKEQKARIDVLNTQSEQKNNTAELPDISGLLAPIKKGE